MAHPTIDHAGLDGRTDQHGARILLSEHHPIVRRLLVILIEELGHEAVVIGDGGEKPPRGDLLLLDTSDPQAVERARDLCQLDWATPIVCMDGLPEASSVAGLGPVGYLQKPFTIATLERSIDAALARVWSCPADRLAVA
jgi:CheY-like chemotaxis protein